MVWISSGEAEPETPSRRLLIHGDTRTTLPASFFSSSILLNGPTPPSLTTEVAVEAAT